MSLFLIQLNSGFYGKGCFWETELSLNCVTIKNKHLCWAIACFYIYSSLMWNSHECSQPTCIFPSLKGNPIPVHWGSNLSSWSSEDVLLICIRMEEVSMQGGAGMLDSTPTLTSAWWIPLTWCTELHEGQGICSGPQRRENNLAISSKRIPNLLSNCVSGIHLSAVLYFGGAHCPTRSLPCIAQAGSLGWCSGNTNAAEWQLSGTRYPPSASPGPGHRVTMGL